MDHPMKEPPPHVEEPPGGPPKRVRTGGRSARVLEQVVAAARDELREHGAIAFSIPRVAKRAGVHVASVYRRWPDVNELIAFTANRYVDQLIPIPDSGSLIGDVTLLLQGSNLTNEPYRTYAGSKDRPLEYIEWGRTYMLGVNYKF